MHIISRKTLRAATKTHPDAAVGLEHWYRKARHAAWASIQDVRKTFPHADAARLANGQHATVFNIGGNKYRLITVIHYNRSKIYVAFVLTHAEYSQEKWKGQL